MNFESRMVAFLGLESVSSRVKGRIFAVEAPQDTAAPFIVWQRITSPTDRTHDGDDTEEILVQISAYAKTFTEAVAIREAIVAVMVDGDESGPVSHRDTRDGKEQERNLFRCDTDFDVWQS